MSSKSFVIETLVGSAESAKQSAIGGANRVVLCCSMPEGGTTPSLGMIKKSREIAPDIDIIVMIRPRGGDFFYTSDELQIMEQDIDQIKELNCRIYGFAFGCLTQDGEIDVNSMKKLMSHCSGYQVTCNRAFDMCKDPYKGIEDLISIGCHRVLTSGQKIDALKGKVIISNLNKHSNGRIIIVPSCGINENNILEIQNATGCSEFQITASTKVQSGMKYRNKDVSMGGATAVVIDEYKRTVSSSNVIKETRALVDQL
ncbi:hypothetical protein M9Y10_028802 [Tritrichomonas musculus]|uniref:Copper homeostasis protein cutC homolog n=1 Tax=Tritrichomonas musculus TaxID=1915356 RepID=A0ABR2KKG8_9EUKA